VSGGMLMGKGVRDLEAAMASVERRISSGAGNVYRGWWQAFLSFLWNSPVARTV
jgi:hypothetical protein